MTNQSKLVSGMIVYLVANILNAAIPFLLLPILTRVLTQEEYGIVAMFATWCGLLGGFIGISLRGASVRKYYDQGLTQKQLGEYIGACIQILLLSSLLVFAITFAFSGSLFSLLGIEENWLFLGVVTTLCVIIFQILLGQWQARKKAVIYGSFQISNSLLDLLLSLVFVLVLLWGAEGRVLGQAYTAIGFAFVAIFFLKKNKWLYFFRWKPDFIKEALSFSIPLVPAVVAGFLLVSIDRIIINKELGLVEVGIYMVAAQFGAGITIVFDAMNKAFIPWLYERLKRNDEKEKRQIVRFTYAWYGLICCGITLAFLIGPEMIAFIAGEDYRLAGELFGWIAMGQGFKGMYLMQTNYIFYSKKTGVLSTITMVCSVLNIMLMITLIKEYGLFGVGYAFAFSMFIYFILTWYAANKSYAMPWSKVF